MKLNYGKETKKWFSKHPTANTTVWQCSKCGLYFKPTLGHKCKENTERK